MNKSTNINNLNPESFDWKLVQNEMKNKLGLDIYESWLKKLHLLTNLIIMFCYQFQQDLFETGSRLDIWIKFYKLFDYTKKILLELNLK